MTYLPTQDQAYLIQALTPLAPQLEGKRIFVTGGTGFFGKWLLESFLLLKGLGVQAEMLVTSRDPEGFLQQFPRYRQPGLQFVAADVRKLDQDFGPFDLVIHAATDASAEVNLHRPWEMLDTTIEGTKNLLEFARKAGAKRFLLASSGAVYGPQPPELEQVPESYLGAPDPLALNTAYGHGKRVAEQLCVIYQKHYGLEPIIARCWAFVGPFLPLDSHFAIGNFIADGLAGRPIVIKGDGTPFRSYLYAADLARWLWQMLLQAPAGRAYNVGSGEGHPLSAIAQMVAVQTGVPVEIHQAPQPGQAPSRYVPDVTRAAQELGLQVEIPLADAIRRTLAFHRGQA